MFKILVILQQQFHKNSKMHIKTLLNTICFNTLQNVQQQLKIQKIIVFNILDPFVANPNNIQISNNDFIFILVSFVVQSFLPASFVCFQSETITTAAIKNHF